MKSLWIVVLCLAGALASAPGAGAHHQPHHPPGDGGGGQQGRTGVLIVDHGEPPEYNADTYESFRAFIEHLLEMGVMPGFLASIDTGTVLQDADCYGCGAASPDRLIDAWLGEHAGPAVWTPSPVEGIAPYYRFPVGRVSASPTCSSTRGSRAGTSGSKWAGARRTTTRSSPRSGGRSSG